MTIWRLREISRDEAEAGLRRHRLSANLQEALAELFDLAAGPSAREAEHQVAHLHALSAPPQELSEVEALWALNGLGDFTDLERRDRGLEGG